MIAKEHKLSVALIFIVGLYLLADLYYVTPIVKTNYELMSLLQKQIDLWDKQDRIIKDSIETSDYCTKKLKYCRRRLDLVENTICE